MKLSTKMWAALGLAVILWGVETWFLVDATGYALTPQVAVIPAATAALAFLPLLLKEASNGLRIAILTAGLFLGGFVFQGVLERSGGTLDTRVAAAQSMSEGRRLLEAELGRERARLVDAEDNMKGESRRGGCGATCKTWQSAAVGIQARIDGLLAELGSQAPSPVADPVSKRFADMTGNVVGEETVRNWRPAFQPLGFVVAIWALFGFAFKTTVSNPGNPSETAAGSGGKGFRIVDRPRTDPELEALRRALNHRGAVTNDELAALMETTKGEASKRVARGIDLGLVSKRRVGRHVAVTLLHAH